MQQSDHNMSDEEVLKAFLLDIDCLRPLKNWTSNVNVFDILKITRTEIRHSNMLAWLLSPTENHGLGDGVLRGLFQQIISSKETSEYDIFKTLLMDYYSFSIQREWRNIDIVAVSDKEKFILCIENKIDSGEHDNQLNRYRSIIKQSYPSYQALFLYLTPEGINSSDENNWLSVSYATILEIIEKATDKAELLPEATMIINNYIETVRRDIVGDERLAQICAEIYAKHRKALDLIFEHKPDTAAVVAQSIREWCQSKQEAGLLAVDLDKCSKTYTRFRTPFMTSLLPDAESASSGWNTKNHYYYEIVNRNGEKITIQFVLSARNIPDNLKEICERINQLFPCKVQKDEWQWRSHFISKPISINSDFSDEKLCELLDKRLADAFEFEKILKENL